MNRTTKRLIAAILVLSLAYGAYWSYRAVIGRPMQISWFFERAFIVLALDNPQLLSQIGLIDNSWLDFHSGKLSNVSPAQALKEFGQAKQALATLRDYDPAALSADERLSARILDEFLAREVEGEKFLFHNYPVNQLFGEQSEVIDFMVTIHQVIDRRSAERYIQRLEAYPAHFDQLIESMDYRAQRGIVPPRFVIQRVLDQMRALLAQKPVANILSTSFAKKLGDVKDLTEAERGALQLRVDHAVEAAVYPAMSKLIDYLATLQTKATTEDGVWKLPDGDAYYAYELKRQTTTDYTPQQVHDLGLSEVARIEAEVTSVLDAAGIAPGTPGQRLAVLTKDKRYLFPQGDDGREAMLSRFREILDEAKARLPEDFSLLPKGELKVESIPRFKEDTAPGAYYQQPALDGSRPGTFFVNTGDPEKNPKWEMKTLAYHEGIPGHHLQLAIQGELKDVPTFRRFLPFTAFAEGWALYAERLGYEIGLESDPLDNAGRLQAELFRAVRLVVDTGIHAKHWTREQAIAYMSDHTGMAESDVTAEIERYIVNPGQACAYKVGMMKILELRDKARTALGAKFDIKDFHRIVTGAGAMPLTVLEQQVDQYIAKEKA